MSRHVDRLRAEDPSNLWSRGGASAPTRTPRVIETTMLPMAGFCLFGLMERIMEQPPSRSARGYGSRFQALGLRLSQREGSRSADRCSARDSCLELKLRHTWNDRTGGHRYYVVAFLCSKKTTLQEKTHNAHAMHTRRVSGSLPPTRYAPHGV